MTRSDMNQLLYFRFSKAEASSAPVIGSRAATNTVSSPAMVPTT
ncbi:hypothetical protein BZL30_8037 [Mycobacterium kansasii]|uniref:Uncharacterized protein n=1 Tax=Mycobacterium kansasii TaxID=1768 RepID=A0A1V3WJR4_MYCKA|nr:hypothetical protein BZL30_8037 [Mycobacterium kansasii]